MHRSRLRHGAVAAGVAAALATASFLPAFLAKASEGTGPFDGALTALLMLSGWLWLFGAGTVFAVALSLAARLGRATRGPRFATCAALALGQPLILIGSLWAGDALSHACLQQPGGADRSGSAMLWVMTCAALLLLIALARLDSGRWSWAGVVWMTLASAAWPWLATQSRSWPAALNILGGDTPVFCCLIFWQVTFAAGYGAWVFGEDGRREAPTGAIRRL